MATHDLAAALERAETVLARRPSMGLHDDQPGLARWVGGTRVVTSHPAGKQMLTDMPVELGGSGDEVSPGWMVRAGLASCTVTAIAMTAAQEGIELSALEVRAESRSDMRGLLGMPEPDGGAVYPGPQDLHVHVRIGAPGVPPERLRALVELGQSRAPMLAAIQDPRVVALEIDVGSA